MSTTTPPTSTHSPSPTRKEPGLKIRFLGAHNSDSAGTGLMSMLVDASLLLDAGTMASRLTFAQQMKIKHVLVTHAHYDHTRDIPSLAMNHYLRRQGFTVYGLPVTLEVFGAHFMDGVVYPDFRQRPPEKATVRFQAITPGEAFTIDGYTVLPVAMAHAVPSVGYQVTGPDGGVAFYTGDTGPGRDEAWQQGQPQLIIAEVTATARFADYMLKVGHLTPQLLGKELEVFRTQHGYLPRVVVSHTSPTVLEETKKELKAVGKELGITITVAHDGLTLNV